MSDIDQLIREKAKELSKYIRDCSECGGGDIAELTKYVRASELRARIETIELIMNESSKDSWDGLRTLKVLINELDAQIESLKENV